MTRAAPLPRGAEKRQQVESMFDRVAPGYDRLNRVMTLGLDRRWRRRCVAALGLPRESLVLDLGCGTGDLCDELRAQGLRAVGYDLSAGMLAAAHTAAPLVRADVLVLPVADGAADGIVSGFTLRNVVDLGSLFADCARVLRASGRLALLETDQPANPVLRVGHRVWFRGVVPLVGAGFGTDRAAYRYLPRSTSYLPPTEELLGRVRAAGFHDVGHRRLLGGAVQLITGTRS